jgi:thioredoxin reductase
MVLSLPLAIVTLLLVFAALFQVRRRSEISAMRRRVQDRIEAKASGAHKAQLRHPHVDLSRCFGCGACVKACPEEGVLEIIHGQAAVVYGARCVGHGLCAPACPVDAISLTLGDVRERKDLPAVTDKLEAVGVPGLFLAGEVTGHALIRTAITHGVLVADEIASRPRSPAGDVLDLCIVGAGPAGFACSLEAKARGLRFVTVDRESLGGTVSRYPRGKLVLSQPVDLPLHGRLRRTSYEKEELMRLWEEIAREQDLPLRTGEEFLGLDRGAAGTFTVRTSRGEHRATSVVLAMGRRGTPRKLGVPGEDLPKVSYALVDAQSHRGRRIVVVGGGDSAVEAAVALSEQEGVELTISYRQAAFNRLKPKNAKRLEVEVGRGRIALALETQVVAITPESVALRGKDGDRTIPNDDVFIMAGGTPPFAALEKAGISFDLSKSRPPERMAERGTDAMRAVLGALMFAAAAWVGVAFFQDYYRLPEPERLGHPLHEVLRPAGTFGLACGVLATLLIAANLLYLPRRAFGGPGSLRGWMTSHIFTGTLAVLLLLFHAALAPKPAAGGYALGMLLVLAATGAVGRYFYAFVPRAANGREAALEEVRADVAAQSAEWDRIGRGFGDRARKEIQDLVDSAAWRTGFFGAVIGLFREQARLRRVLKRLVARGMAEGLSEGQARDLSFLAARAHRTALMAARYENLRGLIDTWRYLHRWFALAMLAMAGIHIAMALRFARLPGFRS